jgi:hypothetical protein
VEDNDEHLLQKAAMDHQCAAADSEMEHDGSNGHLLQRSSLASRSDEENIHPLLADQDSSSSDHAKPWGLMELDDCGDADEKKGSSGSLRALERSLVDQQQRTPKTGRRTNNNTAKKTVKQQQNTSNKKSATNTTSSLLRQSTLNGESLVLVD